MRIPMIVAIALAVPLMSLAAQAQAPTATAARPAASDSTSHDPWGATPAGRYALVADVDGSPRNATLTMTIDSTTHQTKAIIAVEGGETDEMTVKVNEPELVLETDTPDGLMTIRLRRHGNDLTGAWMRGLNGGTIKGALAP